MHEVPAIYQMTFITGSTSIPVEHFGTKTQLVDKTILKATSVGEHPLFCLLSMASE